LLDGRKITPDVLAADLAVAQLEYMEESEAHRTALAVAEERSPVTHETMPYGFVDDEVVAVQAADGRDAFAFDVGKESRVLGTNIAAVVELTDPGRNDQVLGVLSEGLQNAFHVVGRLEHEVIIEDSVHLVVIHRECPVLSPVHWSDV
jgi:hypothetical protein